jgi:hypothetical protein
MAGSIIPNEAIMKYKRILILSFCLIGLITFIQAISYNEQPLNPLLALKNPPTSPDFLSHDMGCTVIYASNGKVAFGGNNEDYNNPFTKAWFLPAEDGKFGRVYFGYEGFLWGGGMNDQGLFFDALAVDQPMASPRDGKTLYAGSLPDKAMAECGTIDCVIDIFSQYHTYDTWYHQFMFGDAYGNSVIVEPNEFLRNEKTYQVVTNFYQSLTNTPTCNNCDRYRTATNLFENAGDYSVDLIREILDAVHLEGGSHTLYSMVYDLKERTVYLYHFHNFEKAFIFQLDEELAKGFHEYTLADLLPENQEYLIWAQQKLNYLAGLRASYQPIQVDPSIYDSYTGDYDLPPELGLPYPFYRIDVLNETLYLKIKTDKGWLELLPLSETTFYHVSSFSQFEVTFLKDEDGEVNQFLYKEIGREYTFNRIIDGEPEQALPSPSPSATSKAPPLSTSSSPESDQTSPSSTGELPVSIPNLGIFLGGTIIIFVGWYLIQRNKK